MKGERHDVTTRRCDDPDAGAGTAVGADDLAAAGAGVLTAAQTVWIRRERSPTRKRRRVCAMMVMH